MLESFCSSIKKEVPTMKFGKNLIKLREVDVYNTELYTPESYSLSMKGIKVEDALNYEFSLVSLMKR